MSPKVYAGIQGKHTPPHKVERVCQLLRDGIYATETARRADVSEYTVRNIAKRYDIPLPKTNRGPQKQPPMKYDIVQDEAQKWRGLAANARWTVPSRRGAQW